MADNNSIMSGIKLYNAKWRALDDDFSQMKKLWTTINEYIRPERGIFSDGQKPNENVSRMAKIINDIAMGAVRTLGAGMQGGLVSPSRPWFKFTLEDPDLAEFGPVKQWLDDTEKVFIRIFAGSNFYSQIHTAFEDEGAYATAPMLILPNFQNIVHFKTPVPGEYRLAQGDTDTVDTIYRRFYMTAYQMAQMFGQKNLSTAVQKSLKDNPFSYYLIQHFIEPRETRDVTKLDRMNMRFKSIWYQVDGGNQQKALRESGFNFYPGTTFRWLNSGHSPYAFGPGMQAIGNTRAVQEYEKGSIKALHKEVDPPMAVPSKYKGVLNLIPGAVNYIDLEDKRVGPLYQIKVDIEKVELKIDAVSRRIERAFFTDLFLLITSSQGVMTATEVVEKQEEKLLLLGPTVERQIESLDEIIDVTYEYADDRGMIPEPPPELDQQPLKVEYISLLAQAQKLVVANSINAYLTVAERVAALWPNSLNKTDANEVLDQYGDIVGVPAKIIRADDDVEEIEEEQRKKQAAQEAIAGLEAGAGVLKDLGGASTAPDTALGSLKDELGA